MSDTETITKNFKRNNLVDMFLRGTEVDEYIINNMYGRGQKLKFDQFDNSIGEMTLLENFNPDETFTDQIKQIHEQSFAFKQRIDDKDDESQNEPEPVGLVWSIFLYCESHRYQWINLVDSDSNLCSHKNMPIKGADVDWLI